MSELESLALARIVNAEVVRQFFGYWPSFHDAEITKVTFEANRGYHAAATFVINAFGMTKEGQTNRFSKPVKHCTIELQFIDIQEVEFDCFSHQNVIFDLLIEESGSNLKCTFDSSVGLDASIVAKEVRVLSLTPATH
ncbi:Imm50 family immunity protein [Hymenobacter wooponensis]|uniref:Uncharacterized protein n=1 Tax=Hymenobacter wooponensis TaxID=1525360 RepID=A0A4Z0MDY1_9BACT|nr:Imm50 family immunity protein [Hymenobacter wooponensis]TGD77973.1 hypothetical protein EU557_22055 [Hymenobacter wooponensis]